MAGMPPTLQVSVLMTSFEHERYVARALDGVLAQEGVDFELIVGDDCSTDSTRAVISEYAHAHPHLIRTFFPERNLGHGGKAIFDSLIGLAGGRYIAMLDADDYWTDPDKLRRQVAYLDQHPDCSMCFHDALCVHEAGGRPSEPHTGRDHPGELGVAELLDHCPVASCSPLFRRGAIDPLPGWYLEMPWGDWPLYFLAAQHGRLRYLPDVMAVYRIHESGMYSGLSRLERLRALVGFYERLEGVLSSEHEPRRRRRLGETWLKLGLEHEQLGDYASARCCLRASLRLWPLSPRDLRRNPREKQRAVLWARLKIPTALRGTLSAPAPRSDSAPGRPRSSHRP
jgi:glycosyltransferase involved in cell wall biosynthesis